MSTKRRTREIVNEQRTGPVGQGNHVVRQGECVESIAAETGHFWEQLWKLPENAALRAARKDPNLLLPGDRLEVPPLQRKEVEAETGKRHVFQRRGVPSRIHVILKVKGEPRNDEPYTLIVDGKEMTGRTSAEGEIKHAIPPTARTGKLVVGEGARRAEYALSIGALDPLSETSGVAGRLANLGLDPAGPERADWAAAALQDFQKREGLTVSGELDQATIQALQRVHQG